MKKKKSPNPPSRFLMGTFWMVYDHKDVWSAHALCSKKRDAKELMEARNNQLGFSSIIKVHVVAERFKRMCKK